MVLPRMIAAAVAASYGLPVSCFIFRPPCVPIPVNSVVVLKPMDDVSVVEIEPVFQVEFFR